MTNTRKPDKIRIVFDFAAKDQEVCPNDHLLQGPDLTNNLVGVLLRFRKEKIAIAADVEEMFLQVRVPVRDRGALRFLWWCDDNLDLNLEEYQLTVHPFGATSSPFCANFALRKAIEEFGGDSIEAVRNAIRLNFYVDDCLVSLPTLNEAETFIHQICQALEKGGFRLRKWMSNKREIIDKIPTTERADTVVNLDSNPLPTERTLGLEWNADTDDLCFKFSLAEKPMTRRGILSCVSSLFDPLGLVGPLLLPAKCLLQELCRKNLGWDEPISKGDEDCWTQWTKFIRGLGEVKIPRCFKPVESDSIHEQLHIFCDASEKGYGAVAYIRCELSSGLARCKILFSKCRVAPLKTMTVPRLELTSAVLAVRIYQILKAELMIPFNQVYFWTDSMVVLHYINDTSSRFSTFVANRLAIIHEHTLPTQWRHINSEYNPADYSSRGFNGKYDQLRIWIDGPEFLSKPEFNWPVPHKCSVSDDILEFKRKSTSLFSVSTENVINRFLSHYSKWFKLLRAMAWMVRYKRYLMLMFGHSKGDSLCVGELKLEELEEARLDVIRLIQRDIFSEDLSILQKAQENSICNS